MATVSSLANIDKLTETNYELWKIQMKSVLVFNDLWKYTEGTEIKLTADAQDWIRKDSKALALINLTRDEIPTLENLKIKLIEEEARQSDRVPKTSEDHNNNDALLAKGRSERSKWSNAKPKDSHTKASAVKFSGKCFNCGKSGHMSRFCKAKPKRSEANDATEAMTAIACKAEIINKSNTWYLDSGATRHMCNNESAFATLKNDERIKVHTASEHFVESGGRGDIKLDAKSNRQLINQVKLKNALYVPELRNNLLSVSSITDNGYTVKFEKDRATVNRKNGSVVFTASKRDQLYVVNERKEQAAFVNEKDKIDLIKWHQRYGHLNIRDLKAIKVKDMVLGMNLASKTNEIDCEVCAKCKIHVKPFKPSSSRETSILGLVHSDICGPISTESIGGAKYFVTFIDDCSRYTEVVMLRNKADVFQAFKNYKKKAENQTGQRIKKFRTDNAREYLSNNFTNFLKEEGVRHQLSVEYTP
ncbi:hypothetical protein PUN28_008795 [Cardiocondyla obscurior]|uniref:Polyprotein n=1 Tax=Cardiocondyla obscurior TaxID=286306 RepID=A0AAW2FPF9_9HYME